MSKSKDYLSENNIDIQNFVPEYLKNPLNSSLSRNLFNKLLTEEESSPMFGLIGDKSTNPDDKRPYIQQVTTERKINALTPLIHAKIGSEDYLVSFSDLLNKAKLLGINVKEFDNWGQCESFNFVPPIDLDKFINFSNYFWYGHLTKSSFKPSWNPKLEPEYYVIGKPGINSKNKNPVEISNTGKVVLNGCGYEQEDWEIVFSDSNAFTVMGSKTGGNELGVVGVGFSNPFISFKILSGLIPFSSGDKFVLTVHQLKDTYSVSYSGIGNGSISGVKGNLDYQVIDGVKTFDGQRVLIKNQDHSGIYVVRPGDWERAEDCATNDQVSDGVSVFVSQGSQKGLYHSDGPTIDSLAFSKIGEMRNITEWSEHNYWIHRDDASKLGLSINKMTQAKRPIVEYDLSLEMNTDMSNGVPIAGNNTYNAEQVKTRFNQLPLFNLFLANGSFAGKISSIFYYEEDALAGIDMFMKRRIKLDSNNDFIFNQGCVNSEDGGMLFFKKAGEICSVWTPGSIEIPKYVAGDFPSTAMEVPVDDNLENGVWKTPFQLEFNPYHENRKTIHFGDLINHFKSIIGKQIGFSGSSFGRNNFRNLPNKDHGRGGKIKEHNGAFNLLVSLLNQEGISPFSIIDFAEQQYAQALTSVNEFVNANIIQFISEFGSPVFDGEREISGLGKKLFESLKENRKSRSDLSHLSLSSSLIPNWPATLPVLGLSPAYVPCFGFDNELGLNVIIHHDGHLSPKNVRNIEFDRALTRLSVTRSDGLSVTGVFSKIAPVKPYKGQLWFKNDTGALYCYNVQSDSIAPLNPSVGDFWYDRQHDVLYAWSNAKKWEVANKDIPWVLVETDKILNDLVLNVETALFDSVHKYQSLKWDTSIGASSKNLSFELAKFAAKHGYDPFAPDFDANDAFTWNYRNANFPLIGNGVARWHNVLKQYFKAVIGVETCRPNLEPWKLFGFTDSEAPATFENTYAGLREIDTSLAIKNVDMVCFDDSMQLSNIVDGEMISTGDRILVIESNQLPNGIYVVKNVGTGANGIWEYAADFNPQDLVLGQNTTVLKGKTFAQTTWVLTGISPIEFTQHRMWTLQMWIDLLSQNPSLKTSVNIFNEQLLPPYVDSGSSSAQFALINSIPNGVSNPYAYGEEGPTELVWKKSLEHSYSLLKCGVKEQPLSFLEVTWGDAYLSVNGLKLNKQQAKKLSHSEFKYHGESIQTKNRARSIVAAALARTGGENLKVSLVCDLTSDLWDFFKINVNGEFIGYVGEDVSYLDVNFSEFRLDNQGFGFEIGDEIKFTVDSVGNINDFEFIPAKFKMFVGLAQMYTQLLQYRSISLSSSRNTTLFKNWQAKMGYRFGSYVKTEGLKIDSNLFNIPLSVCNIVSKVNPFANDAWIQALRIQAVKIGTTKLDDLIYKPVNQGNDWTFRVETYFDKFPQISYYEYELDGEYQTFFALNKRRTSDEWKHLRNKVSIKTVQTPFTITGIQNVVNFLFGYVEYLEDQGWLLNQGKESDFDDETGRLITWQLEIEKFVDAIYNNFGAGNAVILNPFLKNIWFKTPVGLTSKFETFDFLDVTASQFAFDILGSTLSTDEITVVREEDTTSIFSQIPMYGLHVNIETYEHAILFPNYIDPTKREKLIFDPFLGLKLRQMQINGKRQSLMNGRPSFGGYFLSNGEMNRNLVATADDLGKIYDAESAFDNEKISKYALALFGYQGKDYFKDIGTQDKTQFNFWRGLIQAKGTNMSVNAFLNNSAYQEAKIDEYWAFKIAEYGDARVKSFPEMKLQVADCLLDHTRLQFNDDVTKAIPGFAQIGQTDESRWINLVDLEELKNRGMYFDAVSLGKIIINEKPQFKPIKNLGNGTIEFAEMPIVKSFIQPVSLQVVMDDIVNFTVINLSTGETLGTGEFGVKFENQDFSFTLKQGIFEVYPNDSSILEISDDITALVKLPFIADKLEFSHDSSVVLKINQTVVKVLKANTSITVEGFGPQKPKFSPIKFFDYKASTKLGDISFWHPALGQHTPEAYQVLQVISSNDPAKYNMTEQVVNNPNYDALRPWSNSEVGKTWWNTTRLEYTPYFDTSIFPDIENRLSKWGSLADYSNIEVYEWIESNVPPHKYNAEVFSDSTNQNIPQSEKKTGEVAKVKVLSRNRAWEVRPIAWKNQDPTRSLFLTSSFFNKLRLTSGTIGESRAILNFGRFSDFGISSQMSISAWDQIDEKPKGQALITGTLEYVIGSEYEMMSPTLEQPENQLVKNLSIEESSKRGSIGRALGKIEFSQFTENGNFYVRATEINTGKSQTLQVTDVDTSVKYIDFDFADIGVKLRLNLQ